MEEYGQQFIWAMRLEDACIANGQVQLALLGSPFATTLAPQRSRELQILTPELWLRGWLRRVVGDTASKAAAGWVPRCLHRELI